MPFFQSLLPPNPLSVASGGRAPTSSVMSWGEGGGGRSRRDEKAAMAGGRREQLKTAVLLSFAEEPDQINTCDSRSWFYFWWFIIWAQVFHLLFFSSVACNERRWAWEPRGGGKGSSLLWGKSQCGIHPQTPLHDSNVNTILIGFRVSLPPPFPLFPPSQQLHLVIKTP